MKSNLNLSSLKKTDVIVNVNLGIIINNFDDFRSVYFSLG